MEKQEAIEFILEESNKNLSEGEIAAQLSRLLGAPEDIVARFVSRVLANRQPLEPISPASDLPPSPIAESSADMTERDSGTGFSEQTPIAQDRSTPGQADDFSIEKLEAIQDEQRENEVQLLGDLDQGINEKYPDKIHVEVSEPSVAPVWDPEALAKQANQPLSPGEKTALEKEILSALSKRRRQSDIVLMVAEKTGMSWDRSQRLVAEINSKNRHKLNSREGWLQILLSLLAVLAGLALLSSVGSELLTYYRLYAHSETLGTAATYFVTDRYTLWAGVVGFLLFLGGIAGTILGIWKLTD